jgi:hypothetical protein
MGDILVEEMGERVSNGILNKLKSAGLKVDQIDFNELVDRNTGALERPVVNISINAGAFQKVTLTTYKQSVIVSLFIMIQHLGSEESRRFMSYRLVSAIAKVLLLEKLGLPLQDSLKPMSFNNVTDAKYGAAKYLIYQLDLSCSFNIHKDTEKDLGELETIVNHYFLQDPVDDGVQDIEGLVTILGIYGGDPFSTNSVLPGIYGGHPGSKLGGNPIYGGFPGSSS